MRGVKWERIVRVLLNTPDGSLTKYRVAKLARCSIGWTMEYLARLNDQGKIKGTKVTDFSGLLEQWALEIPILKYRDFFHRNPSEIISSIGLDYALTTYVAEDILHHYLFPSRWDLYVKANEMDIWKEAIAKDGLVGRGNIRLLVYDEHALYHRQNIRGLWVASTPQVLVDLKREGGVCGEAYELLLEAYLSRL